MRDARYDRLIEAFGGIGYNATTPADVESMFRAALAAGIPALINCAVDPAAGTQSGHISNLNPSSTVPVPASH
jgi:oxalyl-CoA decarboxylase